MKNWLVIDTKLETKTFDRQIEEVEARLEEIDHMLSKPKDFKLTESDIAKLNVEAEKLNNHLIVLRKQQNEINTQGLKKVSASMDKVIKKVGKWALAVFGVRSAYMLIRQTISTLSQYDKQLSTDIEFIRYAVATILEPVIRVIVQLAYKLLIILNTIWSKVFGVSLFSENIVKNFKNAKNQANNLKKTLAGFDEMNILNGDGSVNGIGISPSFDPSKVDNGISNWVDTTLTKIKNFGKKISNVFQEIFGKIDFKSLFKNFINEADGAWKMIHGIFTNNYDEINEGMGEFINGLCGSFKDLPSTFNLITFSSPTGITKTAEKLGTWLGSKFSPKIGEIFSQLIDGIKQGFTDMGNGFKKVKENIKKGWEEIFSKGWVGKLAKGFVNAIIDVFNTLINRVNDKLISFRTAIVALGKITGKNVSLDTIKIPNIPRLARGGIVNMPSRGVPVGSAIAGERGREGVIPLTDSQQMALLGEAIGKYITINATVVNSMNGRVLSREIQKVQNQSNFAMNR